MTLSELMDRIERDVELRLGVISGFAHFEATVIDLDESRQLRTILAHSWRSRARIRARIQEMVREATNDDGFAYSNDNSLALYLIVLAEVGTADLRSVFEPLLDATSCLWSRRAASVALARLERRADSCFRAQFDWIESSDRAHLEITARGIVIWSHIDRWTDLLALLASHWTRLTWEEGYPVTLDVRDPTEYEIKARDYIEQLPATSIADAQLRLDAFRASHDLSTFRTGLPSFWIVHEGRMTWIGGPQVGAWLCPRDDSMACLRSLADEVASRISIHGEPGSAAVLDAWESACDARANQVVSLATGLREDEVEALQLLEFSSEEFDTTELMAAARMIASADFRHVMSDVIARLRDIPPTLTPVLDDLANAFVARGEVFETKPHEQGYEAALWLRERLHRGDDSINPEQLLREWGVMIVACDLEEPNIEAIAVWGPRHGPAVLVNSAARYRSSYRRNVTLAHEIAHLLLDRHGALPLAEVLGGNVPKLVEQRARAFAAELLLPRGVASRAFTSEGEPERTLVRLSSTYGVSHEVVAWQARNADRPLPVEVEHFLQYKVSRPNLFERY